MEHKERQLKSKNSGGGQTSTDGKARVVMSITIKRGQQAPTSFQFCHTRTDQEITGASLFPSVSLFRCAGKPNLLLKCFFLFFIQFTLAKIVVVPNGCTHVASGAFVNCPNLTEIIVPANCVIENEARETAVTIKPTAFYEANPGSNGSSRLTAA